MDGGEVREKLVKKMKIHIYRLYLECIFAF